MDNVEKLEMLVGQVKATMETTEFKETLGKSVDCACWILTLSLNALDRDSLRSTTVVVKALSQKEGKVADKARARQD